MVEFFLGLRFRSIITFLLQISAPRRFQTAGVGFSSISPYPIISREYYFLVSVVNDYNPKSC